MNIINILFKVISNSDLNSVHFKYYNDEKGAVEEVIYGCIKGSDGRIPYFKLGMIPSVSMKYKKT